MFGLIAAYIFFIKKEFWFKYKNIFFFIGLVILLTNKFILLDSAFNNHIYNNVFTFSVDSISVLFLLPFLNNINSGSGFFYKFFTYTSLISYSMYLLNLSIIQMWILTYLSLLITNDILLAFLKFFLYWFLTIFLSILMYKYVELPFMNLRKKLILQWRGCWYGIQHNDITIMALGLISSPIFSILAYLFSLRALKAMFKDCYCFKTSDFIEWKFGGRIRIKWLFVDFTGDISITQNVFTYLINYRRIILCDVFSILAN